MKWDVFQLAICSKKSLSENETKNMIKWFEKKTKMILIDEDIRMSYFCQSWSHSLSNAIRDEKKLIYLIWSFKRTKSQLTSQSIKHRFFLVMILSVFYDRAIFLISIWSNLLDREWSVVRRVKKHILLVSQQNQFENELELICLSQKFKNELKEFLVT